MLSKNAIALILEFEGIDQPSKWPGGDSGITLGVGYDLGYTTREEFTRDWRTHLTPGQITRLSTAIGLKSLRAKAKASEFRDITITRDAALSVFQTATVPKWETETKRAFPGSDQLPADAFGALVSLVFNRGPSMTGDRRREMREIRAIIENWCALQPPLSRTLPKIASQIRSMKRLWIGKGLDGLLRRREAEARIIELAR